MRTIGIIGNGGHSKRIQKILKRKKLNFFIYKPDRPKYFENQSFKKLKKCKVIFIISPNNSHYNYIKKLHNKNNYIFCEKPPVAKLDELKKIRKIYNGKIYFNFNFRFSKFSEILKNIKKYKLGKLLYANLISSNGLALKKEYKKSWRSNFKQCPKGIFEIVAIHYVDLINFFFNQALSCVTMKAVFLPKVIQGLELPNPCLKSSIMTVIVRLGIFLEFS